MEQTLNEGIRKARNVADIIKEYIIPIIVALVVAGGTYATLNIKLDTAIKDLTRLQSEVYANEEQGVEEHGELLQRIAGMEAKVDYIYEWVKELRQGD